MKNKKKIIIGCAIFTIAIIAIVYLGVAVYYQYHFLPGTTINGKDYSNKTVKAVKDSIQNDIRTYYLKLIERNDEVEHVSAGDIDMKVTIDGDLSKIKNKQNHYLWFIKPKKAEKLDVTIAYDEIKLDYAINGLKCLDDEYINSGIAPELTFDGNAFTMTEGVPGNEIDKEKTTSLIKEAINNMDPVLTLENEGCYLVPIDKEASEKEKKLLSKLNSYLDVVITLTFGEEKEVIDKAQIYKWLSVDTNSEVVFDTEKIIEYIDNIGKKYETMGQTKEFLNSYGETIKVSGGDFGWWINRKAEAEAIINDIKALNSVTREPNFLQRAGAFGENDFGNTYIEINLTTQHLYAYKDGNKIVDCDIISGDPVNGLETPTGVFNMRFMFTNYNFVRKDFTKKLKYWMVFYGNTVDTNIGIASCDWLTSFGGTAYKGAGSLGSIYVNEADAKTLYMELPGKDFPVIIYKERR